MSREQLLLSIHSLCDTFIRHLQPVLWLWLSLHHDIDYTNSRLCLFTDMTQRQIETDPNYY